MSLTPQQRNELFDRATLLMLQAKKYDNEGKLQEAVSYYAEAIDKLLVVLKHIHNGDDKRQLRLLIDQFLRRAEELKSALKKQDNGTCGEQHSRQQLQSQSKSQLQSQQHPKQQRNAKSENSSSTESQSAGRTTTPHSTSRRSVMSLNIKILPNSRECLEHHPEQRISIASTANSDRNEVDRLTKELHDIHIPHQEISSQRSSSQSSGSLFSSAASGDFPPVIPPAPVFLSDENLLSWQDDANSTDSAFQFQHLPSATSLNMPNSNSVVSSAHTAPTVTKASPRWNETPSQPQSQSQSQTDTLSLSPLHFLPLAPSSAPTYLLPCPPSCFQGTVSSPSSHNASDVYFSGAQMPNFADLPAFAEEFAPSEPSLSSANDANTSDTELDKLKIIEYFVAKGFERTHVEHCYDNLLRLNLRISPDFVEILKDSLLQFPPVPSPQSPSLPTLPTHHDSDTRARAVQFPTPALLASLVPSVASANTSGSVTVHNTHADAFPQPIPLSSSSTSSSLNSLLSHSVRSFLTVPAWVPDDKAPNCQLCGQNFTVLYRRHHCRGCGRVVCGLCGDRECPIPRLGYFHPVRVCTECYNNTKLVGVKSEFDLSLVRTSSATVAKTLSESVSGIGVDALYKQFMGIVRSLQGTSANNLDKNELEHIQQETSFTENEIVDLYQNFKENQNMNQCLDLINFRYCCGILGFNSPFEGGTADLVEWLFAAFHSTYYNRLDHPLAQMMYPNQQPISHHKCFPSQSESHLDKESATTLSSVTTQLHLNQHQTNTVPKTTSLNFFEYIRTLDILLNGSLPVRRKWAFLFLYVSTQIIADHSKQQTVESSSLQTSMTPSGQQNIFSSIRTAQTASMTLTTGQSTVAVTPLQHRVKMMNNERMWLPPYVDLTQLTLYPHHILDVLYRIRDFLQNLTLNIEKKSKRIQELQRILQHYQYPITLTHYQQFPLMENIVRFLLALDDNNPSYVGVQQLLSAPPTRTFISLTGHRKSGHAIVFGHPNFNLMINLMVGIQLSVEKTLAEVALVKKEHFVSNLKYRLPSIGENPAVIERRLKASSSPSHGNLIGTDMNQMSSLTDSKVQPSPSLSPPPISTSERVVFTTVYEHPTAYPIDLDFFYYSFKAYAPNVFRAIRRRFHISEEEFLQSIGIEQFIYNLVFLGTLSSYSQTGSHGKSGSIFFYTYDNKFLLKTISESESKTLIEMLEKYYEHLHSGMTLLAPILGLYKLTTKQGREMSIIVMRNVFSTPNEIHILYDLKGSTVGRSTLEKDRKPGKPLKDLDFDRTLSLSEPSKQALRQIIERDAKFLAAQGVMDYSMLLGIHKTQPRTNDLLKQQLAEQILPDGGWPSYDGAEIYYWGIIDYLVKFGTRKLLEHTLKALKYPRSEISAIPADEYSKRFVDFLLDVVIK